MEDVNIPVKIIDIDSKNVEKFGHERTIIYVKDEKYNINGLFFFDPTWDSQTDKWDYINNYYFFMQNYKQIRQLDLFFNYETKFKIDEIMEYISKSDKKFYYLLKRKNQKEKTQIINKLFEQNIDPKSFFKLICNVRKIEYYEQDKYEFSLKQLLDTCNNFFTKKDIIERNVNIDVLEKTDIENNIEKENIKDINEIIKILKENCEISKRIRSEIKDMDCTTKNGVKREIINTDDIIEKKSTKEIQDFEYKYYYDPIKDIPIDASLEDVGKIIKDNLPSKNNSNYCNLINRIKAEIYREILEYQRMLDELPNDEDFIKDIKYTINFEKNKLKIIEESKIEIQNSPIKEQNDLYFFRTSSNNIYCLNDLDKIDKEYYSMFKDLILSIKDGTFKGVKRLTSVNGKLCSISELKGFKTRVLFDKIGPNAYIILMCIIKKCDMDTGYKKALEDRTIKYRSFKDCIIYQLKDEDYRNESKEIEKELFLKLENKGVK